MSPCRIPRQHIISVPLRPHRTSEHSRTTRGISSSLRISLARSKGEKAQLTPWQCYRWQHRSSNQPPADSNETIAENTPQERANAPHKEYFQLPGYAPKPDFTPYERSSQTSSSTTFVPPPPSYLQQHPGAQVQVTHDSAPKTYFQARSSSQSRTDNLLRRFARSSLYTTIFFTLGTVVGTGLITWEYLSPLFEEGSEEEAETLEAIAETLEDHALISNLREDGWKEIDLSSPVMLSVGKNVKSQASDLVSRLGLEEQQLAPHPDSNNRSISGQAEGVGMGRSMLYQMLRGSKGLVGLKMFHHPSEDYSVMVFFTGFGIEGWPDSLHGGIITALLQEAVLKHIEWFHHERSQRILNVGVKMDFKIPVQPGEIYAVLVPPAVVEPVVDQNSLGLAAGFVKNGMDRLKMVGLFMQLEGAPKVGSNIVEQGGAAVQHHLIEVPGSGKIHAVGEVTIKVAAGRESGIRQHELLDSIARSNASFGGNRSGTEDISEER